jgi:hypothetical protein
MRNDKINAIGIFILTIALLFALLAGCSPQKKLNRLKKNHPHLFKTIEIEKEVVLPPISFKGEVEVDTSTSAVDSLFNNIDLSGIDTVFIEIIREKVRNIYRDKKCLNDTAIFINGDITVKVWQEGNLIKHSFDRPKQAIVVKVPCDQAIISGEKRFWEISWFWIVVAETIFISFSLFLFIKYFSIVKP